MNPELAERLSRIAELSDEELAALEADLLAAFPEVETPTDDDLATMREVRDALASVRTQAGERETAAEARRAEAEALRAEVAPVEAEETDDEADDADLETEPGSVEVEPEPESIADAEIVDVTGEPEAEPIAAAAPVRAPLPPRRPATPSRHKAGQRITAAADLQNYSAGARLDSMVDVAKAFVDRADSLRDVLGGDGQRYKVATVHVDYPEERQLSNSDPVLSTQRMEGIAGPAAIRASGGSCAPFEPQYDVPQISDDARPVVAALPRFQASRAGITWVPAPKLGDYNAGVAEWDRATDLNPAGATKPCVSVDCATVATAEVQAITRCLQVGNFFARSYDERVQAILAILRATHARFAETEILEAIGAGSTQITAGNEQLGASRDLLAALELAQESRESYFRQMPGVTTRGLFPEWLHGLVRTDLLRQMPGDGTMSVSDAQIDGWMRDRDIMPSFFVDGEAGQVFPNQGAGPLNGWPLNLIGYVFHEGAWVFLDQGILDLGIVRDSTLNATNDLRIFAETFEGVALRGIWSDRITFDICPSGSSSAPVDVTFCDTGS